MKEKVVSLQGAVALQTVGGRAVGGVSFGGRAVGRSGGRLAPPRSAATVGGRSVGRSVGRAVGRSVAPSPARQRGGGQF